jgi:hypothetical protein
MDLMGTETDKIRVKNEDKEFIEVKRADRFNEEILATVINFYKKKVKIKDVADFEFISDIDMIEFVKDNMDMLKEKNHKYVGSISVNEYQGKFSLKYKLTGIYGVNDDEKEKLGIKLAVVLDKDSVDNISIEKLKSMEQSERRLDVASYLPVYDKDLKENKLTPMQQVIDLSKFDLDNEIMVGYAQMIIDCYTKDSDMKSLKKDKYYAGTFEGVVVNGTEQKSISIKDLNSQEQRMVKMGIPGRDLEYFSKKYNGYGKKAREIRLHFPTNALEEIEIDDDDFYVVSGQTKKMEDVKEKTGASMTKEQIKAMLEA